jgi:hypothetical protein
MLVKAPLDGMAVVLTTRRSGENVQIQEGDQIGSGQPYLRIVDLSNMVVDANVNLIAKSVEWKKVNILLGIEKIGENEQRMQGLMKTKSLVESIGVLILKIEELEAQRLKYSVL